MNAVAAYAFEDNLFRSLDREGDPWFIAGDVAKILGYRIAPHLTRSLDDDEKGIHLVDTLGGSQEVAIISEPGLYRAIIQRRASAKLTPEVRDFIARFQRWVFHDLLPTLRQTGRYGAPPASVEREQEAVVRERELCLETVAEARRLYGAERARHLWERLGLPEVPPLPDDTASPTADILERKFLGDVVARKLQSIAEAYGTWTGTAAQLLAEMNADAYPLDLQNRRWPRTSQALGMALARVRPLLLHRGIRVERRHSGIRTITIILKEIE
ncbi:hypothetical protein MBUL_04496 (plasmid) [Methylobacterium bullatum]|uniref:Bro-N domain-containing protein n=1 Tax=Methylobacterium bullatum TaxID=570505 RepID=A0A679JRY2_9HYPH|nr:hypothetical protein MBUL_04496 [Methylobacterium bullatum]